MSNGNRQRPWQRPAQHAVTDTILHGTHEAIGRAAVAAAEDRSLDVVRNWRNPNIDYYEPRPWYEKRPGPLAKPRGTLDTLKPGGPLRCKSYILRAISNPVTRGIGKALGFTVKGVPVVGTAAEMFHSSPLADGTLRAAGRQMMNRYRTGRDPFKGYVNLTNRDKRRAEAFMTAGINPLRPGWTKSGLKNVYAGDYKPMQPIGGNVNMVFDPEWVHRSPQIVPVDRSRPKNVFGPRQPSPWAAVGGPPVFGSI